MVILLAGLEVGVRAAPPVTPRPILLDRIVAEVDGEVISTSDLSFWIWQERLRRPETYVLPDSALSPEVLRNLADEILLAHWAAEKLKEVDDQEIDRSTERAFKAFKQSAPTQNRFEEWLNEAGYDTDGLRGRLRDREKRLWLIRTALATVHSIRPERLEGSERTREEVAERPVRVRIRQILLRCSGRADDLETSRVLVRALRIRREILDGMPFSEAAELYSDDRGTREAGGFVGWVQVASLSPALQASVSAAKRGEVTPPVRTGQGWHLIQVLDYESPASLVLMQKVREAYNEVLGQLRQERTVRTADGFVMAPPKAPDRDVGGPASPEDE